MRATPSRMRSSGWRRRRRRRLTRLKTRRIGWPTKVGELWDDVVAEAGDVFEAIEDFAEERWKDAMHFVDDLSIQLADAVEDAWQ